MSESDDGNNVIHVTFGPEGGAPIHPKGIGTVVNRPNAHSPEAGIEGRTPLADLYSTREVARLFELTPSRLRYWDSTGFIRPSARHGQRRYYTFRDLLSVRVAKSLIQDGLPLQKVRKSVEALRDSLPRVTRPLADLRVVTDGHSIVVKDNVGGFEPTTGQRIFDFDVGDLRDDVVRVLRPQALSDSRRQEAYEHYLEGCRLDENEATFDQAEEAYRRAIQLDMSLSNALTNLGNLKFRRGSFEEARLLYHQALEVDPAQPEADYNLGFLYFDGGDAEKATEHFRRALAHDPAFADAHFNLAMAYEELGRAPDAQAHWETYLQLDPAGPWAEIARRHLGGD